jgi:hypothetical protein
MKKVILGTVLTVIFIAGPVHRASAQLEIIEEVIKEAIMAIDLGIQKVQTQTVYLQDAQKEVENAMQQLHLTDITGWVQKQKDLYSEYYQELWEIKNAISAYQRIKDMINKEQQLLSNYKQAYALIQQDKHFSQAEITHIYNIYSGIINQSSQNIGQVTTVINAFITQMSDGDRLRIIDEAGDRIDKNYIDCMLFTQQNIQLSLERSNDMNDLTTVKLLYGIQ